MFLESGGEIAIEGSSEPLDAVEYPAGEVSHDRHHVDEGRGRINCVLKISLYSLHFHNEGVIERETERNKAHSKQILRNG